MIDDMYDACQVARDWGTIFHDEFLQWCYSEGLYTPLQVLIDSALMLAALVGGAAILWYWVSLFRRD